MSTNYYGPHSPEASRVIYIVARKAEAAAKTAESRGKKGKAQEITDEASQYIADINLNGLSQEAYWKIIGDTLTDS
jgi:hypothetical protein